MRNASWPGPYKVKPLGIETTGGRLFEDSLPRLDLEIVRVIDTPEATHIHYRVRR